MICNNDVEFTPGVLRESMNAIASRQEYVIHHLSAAACFYTTTTPENSRLGNLPRYLMEFYGGLGTTSDKVALRKLVESRIIETWCTEWAAFETLFPAHPTQRRSNTSDGSNGYTAHLYNPAFAARTDLLRIACTIAGFTENDSSVK